MQHTHAPQKNPLFVTTMSARARILFGLAAAAPLLAPYELLLRPDWSNRLSPGWILAALVSLGALGVTLLLGGVAVFGLNREVRFDTSKRVVLVTDADLLRRSRTTQLLFADVMAIAIISHDWSDGPSTYELRLSPSSGKEIAFGAFASRQEAELVRTELWTMVTGMAGDS